MVAIRENVKRALKGLRYNNYSGRKQGVIVGSWSPIMADFIRQQSIKVIHRRWDETWPQVDWLLFRDYPKRDQDIKRAKQYRNVVAFEHGMSFGTTKHESAGNLYRWCNYFVCATSGTLRLWKESFKSNYDTRLVTVESDYYYKLATQKFRRPAPHQTRKVMVIGFPFKPGMSWQSMGWPKFCQEYFRSLEMGIVWELLNDNYKVLYQAHPATPKNKLEAYSNLRAKVLQRPFERTWKRADAYVFPHTNTTCFGTALLTRKKIVAFKTEGKQWAADSYDTISQRCFMVNGLQEMIAALMSPKQLDENIMLKLLYQI